jgi:DNA-binding transcriptional ArsR family regulator
MARAATTTDAFNAVAEPRRREILDLLAGGERSVTELVESLGLSQPLVSKHLRVLRDAGAVTSRVVGRRRVYRLGVDPLPDVLAWVNPYHARWSRSLDRLAAVLDAQEDEPWTTS